MKNLLIVLFVFGTIQLFTPQHANAQDLTDLNVSGVQEHGHYGWDIAIYGDVMAVSAPHIQTGFGKDAGKVDLYRYNVDHWEMVQEITPLGGEAFENFGFSIGLHDGILAVGAIGNFDNGPFSGCVYVFEYNGTMWTQTEVLYPEDAHIGMYFGYDLAITENTIIASAMLANGNEDESGAVYAFTKSDGEWSQSQKLIDVSGVSHDRFGCSVAINNSNTLVVGAYHNSLQADKAGAAFVFEKDDSIWGLSETLLASTFSENDMFGYGLDICNNVIAVGAFHADGAKENSGSVFVFEKETDAWSQTEILAPLDGERNDFFGVSIALAEERLLVGASRTDIAGNYDVGSVYSYDKTAGLFGTGIEVDDPTGDAYNNFGLALALDSTQIVIASRLGDSDENDGGAVYYSGVPSFSDVEDIQLKQIIKVDNYPNPTTAKSTTIEYFLPFPAYVELNIYNLEGSYVANIVSGKENTGKRYATWNCKTNNGSDVTPGIYVYKLSINGNVFSNKIVVAE